MIRALAIAAVIVAGGGHATLAAGSEPVARCQSLARLKKDLANEKITGLTPGQFHFAQGVYVGSPATPAGLPPGDGALLVQHPGNADVAVLIWTRGERLACLADPIPGSLAKLIVGIKSGPLDDDGNEM